MDRSIDGFPRFFLGEVGCWVFGQMAAHESLTRQRVPPICTHPHTRQRASRPSMDDRGRSRKKINARRETRDAGRLIPYTRYKNTHVMRKNTRTKNTSTPGSHRRRRRRSAVVTNERRRPGRLGGRILRRARAHEGDDHGRRSHGEERVDARGTSEREGFIFFSKTRANPRAGDARTRARRGEGDTAHRWRNDPRGTGTRARVTSRGTFGATTTTAAAATTATGDGNG